MNKLIDIHSVNVLKLSVYLKNSFLSPYLLFFCVYKCNNLMYLVIILVLCILLYFEFVIICARAFHRSIMSSSANRLGRQRIGRWRIGTAAKIVSVNMRQRNERFCVKNLSGYSRSLFSAHTKSKALNLYNRHIAEMHTRKLS